MFEKDIEKWLKQKVEDMGGLALKFTSPGNAGVPDRIIILPGGRVYFVELKAEGGRLSQVQMWMQLRMSALGCHVRTVNGREDAAAFIKELGG